MPRLLLEAFLMVAQSNYRMGSLSLTDIQSLGLSSSIKTRSHFVSHYYNNILRGRGLSFADQRLMNDEMTVSLIKAYAPKDGSSFRRDFARAMIKMPRPRVLTN